MTRILYIDDEADIREIVAMCLQLDSDLDVRCCATGAEGIAVARKWSPDLILLDVMMPEIDGPMTLKSLASDERTAGIPVVFITARTQKTDVAELKALGARGVIAKPFNPTTLAQDVRAFL